MLIDHHPDLPINQKKPLHYQWNFEVDGKKSVYMITHLITADTSANLIREANIKYIASISLCKDYTLA